MPYFTQIKEKYREIKGLTERKLVKDEKESLLKELNNSYNNIEKTYITHIEKISSQSTKTGKLSNHKNDLLLSFYNFVSYLKPSPVLKLRSTQEKILTQVLNNLELYNTDKLKEIFTSNYQAYEKYTVNTNYALLVKSLLEQLESNIIKLDEKEKKERQFSFDLEKRLHEEPTHLKELLDKAENRIQDIKKSLREGANEKDFDQLGTLLHGYIALQRVLRKAGAKK